jgi:hypothetical protein
MHHRAGKNDSYQGPKYQHALNLSQERANGQWLHETNHKPVVDDELVMS